MAGIGSIAGLRAPGGTQGHDWDPLIDLFGPQGYMSLLAQGPSGRNQDTWEKYPDLTKILGELTKYGQQKFHPGDYGRPMILGGGAMSGETPIDQQLLMKILGQMGGGRR